MTSRRSLVGIVSAFAAFIACIVAANWAAINIGSPTSHGIRTIPVLPGCVASSAIIFVGFSLTARDILQRVTSARIVLVAILSGAALSVVVAPQLALASGATFLVSETLDWAVYTPLRRHSLLGAIVLSNTAGAFADSLAFLTLAFGAGATQSLIVCQTIGKIEWSLLLVPILAFFRRRERPES